jgi:hypothetical protein
MIHLPIGRNLDLSQNSDKDYFYSLLASSEKIPFTVKEIKDCVHFLSIHLSRDEWLKVYPIPSFWGNISTAGKVGKSRYQSLDFFYDVIPLARNLISLQYHEKFDGIIKRLDIPSHERLSTILEVQVAANYQAAGFEVDLQPENGKGGLCDLRIRLKDKNEWIYVECKVPNTSDSQRIIGRQKIIDDLAQTVLKKTEPFLPLTHRIEIHLSSRFKRQKNYEWLDSIIYSIKNNELEYWKASSGIKYCINSINSELRRPPKYMTSGVTRTTGYSTQIFGSGVHISYSAGNFRQKLTQLIKDARNQLPDNQRDIIVIKSINIALIEQKIREIIKVCNKASLSTVFPGKVF